MEGNMSVKHQETIESLLKVFQSYYFLKLAQVIPPT